MVFARYISSQDEMLSLRIHERSQVQVTQLFTYGQVDRSNRQKRNCTTDNQISTKRYAYLFFYFILFYFFLGGGAYWI